MSTDKSAKPAKPTASPDLAAQLTQANALVQELHGDLTTTRAEVARLTSALNEATAARGKADDLAAQAEAARKAAIDSIPGIASRQAAAVLASVGHTPLPAGNGASISGSGAPGSPEEIRSQFARMTPGSPEATAFWKQHRAVLIGR